MNKNDDIKIAICFYGQPRFIENNYNLMFENLIDLYHTDIFAHLWFDEELISKPYKYGGNGQWQYQRISKDAIHRFQEIYEPKELIVEPSKKFNNSQIPFQQSLERYWGGASNNLLEPDFQTRTINNVLSRSYSLQSVNQLKKNSEYQSNFKYDWVFAVRTDLILKSRILLKNFNKKDLNFSSCQKQPDKMVNDWFNFGSSEVMDCFMNIFGTFELLIDKVSRKNRGAWCPELLHKEILKKYRIKAKGSNIVLELPRY